MPVKLPTTYQDFIYKRTYSRYLHDQNRRETFDETVARYYDFFVPRIPEQYRDEWKEATNAIVDLEVMPSMRALWTAGEALERENLAGFNCSYLAVNRKEVFSEALYILMNGTGLGFSVERQNTNLLPEVPSELVETEEVLVIEDSKEGWAQALRTYLERLYDGEIPHLDYSLIRPKGAILKVFGGRASGPEPLKELMQFVRMTFENAKGRKLSSLECHDIMCYIAKIVVVGGVRRSACISLSNRSDDRMAKAKIGQFWLVAQQRALANNSIAYTEKPNAEEFMADWLNLIRSKCGERGIFNRESAEFVVRRTGRRKVVEHFGTNPCLRGDMMLLTDKGYERFDSLDGQVVGIVTPEGKVVEGPVWKTGTKDTVVVKFLTPGVDDIVCTPDHRFMLTDGTECEAKDLVNGRVRKKVSLFTPARNVEGSSEFLAGYCMGDACLSRMKSPIHKKLEVYFGEKDGDVADLFGQGLGIWYSEYARKVCEEYGLSSEVTYKRLPPKKKVGADFLSGMYSGNGSVVIHTYADQSPSARITYKTTSKEVADWLVSELRKYGINGAYITTNKSHLVKHSNGEYESRESYDVNIAKRSEQLKFLENIGFAQEYKTKKLVSFLKEVGATVAAVIPAGKSDVYDFNVEGHWGIVNGVITHNCSEIILRDSEVCNLSEVVVRYDDTLDTLKEKVRKATILGVLQSTLDKYQFVSDEWKKNIEEERLLGVSLTGLRDHPVLGHTSDEARVWLTAMKQEAIDTARIWSERLNINMPAAITCCKPSGTVSQLVNSASGVHPRYARYYIRRVRVSTTDPIFQMLSDKGLHWEPEVGEDRESCRTAVFAFPVESPVTSVMNTDVTAIEQLEYWKMIQKYWCEHKPSVTIFVKDSEWLAAGAWVYENWKWVSGISFLPFDGGIYPLAPYEAIDEKTYNEMKAAMPEIDFEELPKWEKIDATMGSREFACHGGACEL